MSEPIAATIWPEKKSIVMHVRPYDLPEIIQFADGSRRYTRLVMVENEEHRRMLDALEKQNPDLGASYFLPYTENDAQNESDATSTTMSEEKQYSVVIPNPPHIDGLSMFDGTYAQCEEYIQGALQRYRQLVDDETKRGVQGLLRSSLRPPQMWIEPYRK
jgi:hypothetical protein